MLGSDVKSTVLECPFGLGVENCNEEYALGYRETGEEASGFGVPSGMKTCVCVGGEGPNYNRKGFFV